MNFFVLGVNHKTAPVHVRERFAVPEARMPEALSKLTSMDGVEEAMIVSTCNRVEIFARGKDTGCDLQQFVREYFGFNSGEYEPYIFEHKQLEAVKHVFRVAASLDSMVVGESQILGQVKEAYATARALGTINSQLDQLLTRAFAVAKKVRTETTIASSSVSIASVAVELAEKIFGSLHGKSVYLVGAGKMCELAARHLIAHGASKIYVGNRTYDRAVNLANKFNGEAIPFDRLYETVPQADIIISSTGAPHAIFEKQHGEKFLHARKNRPMFFIDIAVPRDIDPGLNDLDGIFVYNIDDLQQVVASHLGDRKKEAARAEVMVDEEVRRFEQRAQTADVVPTIVSLQQHLETLRQAELDRVRGRLGALSPEQEMAIETLTRGIINKIMHTPITHLKSAARDRDTEATTVVDVVRKLFNLRSESGGEASATAGQTERRVADRRAADRGTAERRSGAASSPESAGAPNAQQTAAAGPPVPPLVANQSRK